MRRSSAVFCALLLFGTLLAAPAFAHKEISLPHVIVQCINIPDGCVKQGAHGFKMSIPKLNGFQEEPPGWAQGAQFIVPADKLGIGQKTLSEFKDLASTISFEAILAKEDVWGYVAPCCDHPSNLKDNPAMPQIVTPFFNIIVMNPSDPDQFFILEPACPDQAIQPGACMKISGAFGAWPSTVKFSAPQDAWRLAFWLNVNPLEILPPPNSNLCVASFDNCFTISDWANKDGSWLVAGIGVGYGFVPTMGPASITVHSLSVGGITATFP
jgi:hypothetical protein